MPQIFRLLRIPVLRPSEENVSRERAPMRLPARLSMRARTLGGDMTIHLKAGEKLMMATWKGEDLFYLTEPMEEGYVPKVKFFYENSSYGVLETTVKFVESR